MAIDGQYVGKRDIIAYDALLGGFVICHTEGRCSVCQRAKKYDEEHYASVRA